MAPARKAQVDGAVSLVIRIISMVFYLGGILASAFGFDNPEGEGGFTIRTVVMGATAVISCFLGLLMETRNNKVLKGFAVFQLRTGRGVYMMWCAILVLGNEQSVAYLVSPIIGILGGLNFIIGVMTRDDPLEYAPLDSAGYPDFSPMTMTKSTSNFAGGNSYVSSGSASPGLKKRTVGAGSSNGSRHGSKRNSNRQRNPPRF